MTLKDNAWVQNPILAKAVTEAGLPLPDGDYFTSDIKLKTMRMIDTMADHFGTEFGPLLVPNPKYLDTRAAMPDVIRAAQPEITKADFLDQRLGPGVDATDSDKPWSLFVTIIAEAGLPMGSYNDIMESNAFSVGGYDTRRLMIRQLWGALVLQRQEPPDSNLRSSWTFTLFPGEELVDKQVISGTVLHGQVRQRLGKTTRGIVSARVRPAVQIPLSGS